MVWRYFRLTRFVISASRDFEVCYAFVDDDAVDAKPVSQQIRSGSLRGWFMTSIQPFTTRTCSEIFCCELEVCGTVFHSRQIWAFPFLAVSFRSQFAPRVAKVSRWIDRSRSSSCTFATKFNEGAKITSPTMLFPILWNWMEWFDMMGEISSTCDAWLGVSHHVEICLPIRCLVDDFCSGVMNIRFVCWVLSFDPWTGGSPWTHTDVVEQWPVDPYWLQDFNHQKQDTSSDVCVYTYRDIIYI